MDPLEDDDDIEWKYNPFDADHINESGETPEELLAKITFEGSPQLQTRLKVSALEFIDVFATKARRAPADIEPMKIVVDREKWRLPCNRAPLRRHFREETEGDQEASGCTPEARHYQKVVGHGMEPGPLGPEAYT